MTARWVRIITSAPPVPSLMCVHAALAIRRATQEVQSIVESKLSAEEKIRQLQSKCIDTVRALRRRHCDLHALTVLFDHLSQINESKRIDRSLTRSRRVTQREGDAGAIFLPLARRTLTWCSRQCGTS